MAVTFGSTATAINSASGTTPTWALTTASTDTRLVVLVGKASGASAPTGVTYNGVALTPDGNAPQGFNLSVWHLDNPPAGTFNVIVTISVNASLGAIAIPLAGANLSLAPVLGTPTTGSSASAICSVTGAGSNDLQIAQCMVVSTTMATTGANQTVVTSSPTMPLLSINAAYSFSADSILGANAGNFAWSLTSGTWNALGITIFGQTGTGPVLPLPSVTIAATTSATAGILPNGNQNLQIANQSTSWAFVNFGIAGNVVAATVAASYPIGPGHVIVVTVPSEVTGMSVILATGTGNVTFTRMRGPNNLGGL